MIPCPFLHRRLCRSWPDLDPADRCPYRLARRASWRAHGLFQHHAPGERDAACRRHRAGGYPGRWAVPGPWRWRLPSAGARTSSRRGRSTPTASKPPSSTYPRRRASSLTLDCDGLDPSVMPGVGRPHARRADLSAGDRTDRGVSRRARLAGFDLIEFHTPADIDGITAPTAARLLVNVIGRIVQAGLNRQSGTPGRVFESNSEAARCITATRSGRIQYSLIHGMCSAGPRPACERGDTMQGRSIGRSAARPAVDVSPSFARADDHSVLGLIDQIYRRRHRQRRLARGACAVLGAALGGEAVVLRRISPAASCPATMASEIDPD